MTALTVSLTFLAFLACSAPAYAAGMRCFDNLPVSPEVQAGRGSKLIEAGYLDVTKPPYNADQAGTADAAPAIQRAIADGYNMSLVVYVPEGDVSDRLTIGAEADRRVQPLRRQQPQARQSAGRRHDRRHVPGAQGRGRSVRRQDALYRAICPGRWCDAGRPGPPLRLPDPRLHDRHGRQSDGRRDVTAGRPAHHDRRHRDPGQFQRRHQQPARLGRLDDQCQDRRRQYRHSAGVYRPTPSIHGLELVDQKVYGIELVGARGGIEVAGFKIRGSGVAGVRIPTKDSGSHPARNLVATDGTFELAGPAISAAGNAMYLRNVYAKTPTIVRQCRGGRPAGTGASAWTKVGEYATTDGGLIVVDGASHELSQSRLGGAAQPDPDSRLGPGARADLVQHADARHPDLRRHRGQARRRRRARDQPRAPGLGDATATGLRPARPVQRPPDDRGPRRRVDARRVVHQLDHLCR